MNTQVSEGNTVLPPEDLEAMLDLSKFLDQVSAPAALVGPDGQTVALPLEAFRVLRQVAQAMRVGKAITVAPIDQLLTTQEAATFLGISRPTLVSCSSPRRFPSNGRPRVGTDVSGCTTSSTTSGASVPSDAPTSTS